MKARGWRVFATVRKADDIKRLTGEGLETLFLEYADEDSIEATVNHVLEATGGRIDAPSSER